MATDTPHMPIIAVAQAKVIVNGVASIISSSGARTKIYGTIKAAIANFAAAKPVFIGSAPEIPAPA